MLNAGYHAVPPGMIATVVTSLEMLELPTLRPEAPDPNWRLDRLAPDPTEYRRLYRAIARTGSGSAGCCLPTPSSQPSSAPPMWRFTG